MLLSRERIPQALIELCGERGREEGVKKSDYSPWFSAKI